MDLRLQVSDKKILYIRVAAILRTEKGLLFEKHPKRDYIYPLGGKIAFGESSEEALRREIMEEIGVEVQKASLLGTLENFYTAEQENVHEISFFYYVEDIFTGIIPENMIELRIEELDKYKIMPKFVKQILKREDKKFIHLITRNS